MPIVVGNYSHVLDIKSMSFENGTITIRGVSLFYLPRRMNGDVHITDQDFSP